MRVKFAVILMLSAVVFIALGNPARAQVADSGCDPEYMVALDARAWFLGNRRVAMNNNLILKPDSVIEYSCLNEAIDVVAASPYRRLNTRTYHDQTLTDMHMQFSESGYWGPISTFSEYSTDSALTNIVGRTMVNYLDDNFMHYYLGTRVTTGPSGSPSIWGVFDCISISYIWHIARCMEFMDEYDLDGFFDFYHYLTFDPRQLPPDFGACPVNTSVRETHLKAAFGGETNYMDHVVQDDWLPILDGAPYDADPIVAGAHLDRMLPGSCADSPMIPTGITIDHLDLPEYEEFFCVRPGCSYNSSAGRCIE